MSTVESSVAQFKSDFDTLKNEVAKVIVGQTHVIEGALTGLILGGHILLEGVPGLGKTRLVRALADAVHLQFARIQFTPDLMPADVVGTTMIIPDDRGGKRFQFEQGPIFANIVLADEVNRATPKTQSAMLEAMQEGSVTVGKTTYDLQSPFLVLATQNPLEMEGTYPLPEAQLDRFLYKLHVQFPSRDDLHTILDRTTGDALAQVTPVLDGAAIQRMRTLALDVPIARHIQDYAIRLVEATHPTHTMAPAITRKYVRYGSSPRGAQALILAGKVRALADGRFNVSAEDIQQVAHPALRHRMILGFEGEAEGVSTDAILADILSQVQAT